MKIVVLDGDVINPGDISWAPLEKLGEVAIYGDTPEDLIVERAAGAEVLVTNKVPLRSGTLSRLPDLRMVAVLATGYDIIDTADAAAHGIPVCNVVAYGVDDVAQHAWALLLELCRRTGEHTASVCAGEWKDTWCYWKTTPVCLRGRTLGVIGFGSIGRRVGELGHAFGMSVLANCRTPRNPPSYSPFAFASTDQIFQQADVISLHCPLTDATRALINAKALARMKPGAILINAALCWMRPPWPRPCTAANWAAWAWTCWPRSPRRRTIPCCTRPTPSSRPTWPGPRPVRGRTSSTSRPRTSSAGSRAPRSTWSTA